MRALAVTVPMTLPAIHGGVTARCSGAPMAGPATWRPSSRALEDGSGHQVGGGGPPRREAGDLGRWRPAPARRGRRCARRSCPAWHRPTVPSRPLQRCVGGQPRSAGCVRPSVATTVIASPPKRCSISGFAALHPVAAGLRVRRAQHGRVGGEVQQRRERAAVGVAGLQHPHVVVDLLVGGVVVELVGQQVAARGRAEVKRAGPAGRVRPRRWRRRCAGR